MVNTSRFIYLHGSESDSNSGKARQFREWFPGMLTPDFTGSFDERMSQVYSMLDPIDCFSFPAESCFRSNHRDPRDVGYRCSS